jgi:hypothetical protein
MQTIGDIKFIPKLVTWDRDSKRNKILKIPLSAARAAFLGLVAINWSGFATVFDLARKNPSEEKKLNYAWYNFGGNNSYLNNAIKKGRNKKAKMFLAPRKLKDAYKDAISSDVDETSISGIGSPTGGAAEAAATSTPVWVLLVPLATDFIFKAVAAGQTKKQIEEANKMQREANRFAMEQAREEAAWRREQAEKKAEEGGFSLTDEEGNITTAGYGLIGVGVLGLLLLGTKKKGKKLF